ncbi:8-amino-7-oxononanoate synthase [Corynebacterium yudongzhengii]|uniref:8-amino-7-oxononanoate synthase n=1 Tax=Corynebacterium yudongzhengii TaxID=2080740 RepID=A0A2U1T5D5_9CORY|nr:aminotransferase class I/II-fold pyridoxal phosphate-dependent enzyme [Corynebacterium yudongzhengii]AWB81404.1 8-amino-7-oxononanoate synthase [Corynebacterium yudongzhengii]PWC01098.1 8-amino-7-oxononanoate synthase [Corynebacterium yudongzhengii]
MTWLEASAEQSLNSWRRRGLERIPATFASAPTPEAVIDSRTMVLFSSSNYLGLAQHPRVIEAASRAGAFFGAGSGGSRLTTGTTSAHREVERVFAEFLGYPEAVLFSSGFAANTGTLQALAGPGTVIVSDERNHASIIDGCRLAKAQGAAVEVYPHRDMGALERVLDKHHDRNCLVVSDGLFSMDGTVAALPELMAICRAHEAAVMVDDAHGTGTLGASGRGIVEHFQLHNDAPDVLVATASKALGAEGAVVAGSPALTELLRQKARSYVYSTSPAPATCAAIAEALDIIAGSASPLGALRANIDHLSHRLGWKTWETPIFPIPIGGEEHAVAVSESLREQGFFVPAIRYPTVARNRAILRVTLMATHTAAHIDSLANALDGLIHS